MDGGALVAEREHLAHADDKSQHSVTGAECWDCSAARTSCSHRAVKATPSGACTALADDPRGAHALDLCRSSWWLQRLWVKRLCWLCSAASHPAHAEAGRVRAEAICAFSTFTGSYTHTTSPPVRARRSSYAAMSGLACCDNRYRPPAQALEGDNSTITPPAHQHAPRFPTIYVAFTAQLRVPLRCTLEHARWPPRSMRRR